MALRADEQRRLQRERGRGAAGRSLTQLDRGLRRIGERHEIDQTEFGLKRDHCTVEQRPGGAHPRTQDCAMGGSLVMGMVPGMLDRLSLCQSADRQDTAHQEDRDEFENSVVHQYATSVT